MHGGCSGERVPQTLDFQYLSNTRNLLALYLLMLTLQCIMQFFPIIIVVIIRANQQKSNIRLPTWKQGCWCYSCLTFDLMTLTLNSASKKLHESALIYVSISSKIKKCKFSEIRKLIFILFYSGFLSSHLVLLSC